MKCLRFFAENVNDNGEFTNQQMLHISKEGTGDPSSAVYNETSDSSVFNRAFNAPIEHGNNINLIPLQCNLTRVSPLDMRRSPTRKHNDRIEKENENFARDLVESNLRSPSKGPNVSGNVRNAKYGLANDTSKQAFHKGVGGGINKIEESQKNKTSQKICRSIMSKMFAHLWHRLHRN